MNFSNPIRDILQKELITIHPNTLAEDVKLLFNENNIHHIPVVNDYGKIEGIISKVDLYRMEKLVKKRSSSSPPFMAKNFMTKHPVFMSPDNDLIEVADLFLKNKIHALPIVEDGVAIGIITSHDLLKLAIDMPNAAINEEDLELDDCV